MGYGRTSEFYYSPRTSRHCEICDYDITDLEHIPTCPFCYNHLNHPKFKIRPLGCGLIVPDASACLKCKEGGFEHYQHFSITPYKPPVVSDQPRKKLGWYLISLFRQVPPPQFEFQDFRVHRRRDSSQELDSELWNSVNGSTRLEDSLQESSTKDNSQHASQCSDADMEKNKRGGDNAEGAQKQTTQEEVSTEEEHYEKSASEEEEDDDEGTGDADTPAWIPARMDALPTRLSVKGVLKKDPPKQGMLSKLMPYKASQKKQRRSSKATTRSGKIVTFADELGIEPSLKASETSAAAFPPPPKATTSADKRFSLLERARVFSQVRVERRIWTRSGPAAKWAN
eukprot:6189733-Pleurochrysis_carterae.AAC.2